MGIVPLRSLHKDTAIECINKMVAKNEQHELRWILVEGDVFRPPKKGMLLATFVGNGVQIAIMMFITLILACLGFLSPANPGSLLTCIIVLYISLGTPAGKLDQQKHRVVFTNS